MSYQTVELVKEGNTATLYLNRIESLNAMNVPMLAELAHSLKAIAESDVKLLFITGKGRAFSAGGDLKTMLSNTDETGFHSVMEDIKDMIVTLYTMPAVTISLLNGPAAGLGLSFALASDMVIAQTEARVAMNFINIGLVPDGGGHFFLKKRLGEHMAKQVIWEGKSMDATEALKVGLVDEVYKGNTEDQIEVMKKRMETRPLLAMIASKLIYSKQETSLLIDTLNMETRKQLEMRGTKDHHEGVHAFLEKRLPQFRGH